MSRKPPRIASVTPIGPASLGIEWKDASSGRVDLTGWIATGGDILRALDDPALFATARSDAYGAAVLWGDEDGDLAIDAAHLALLAEEQRPFGSAEAVSWQHEMGLSNQETADLLGVAPSTWNTYKAGARIPQRVGMLCRALRRDPMLMQAYYRPRRGGRPRRAAS